MFENAVKVQNTQSDFGLRLIDLKLCINIFP